LNCETTEVAVDDNAILLQNPSKDPELRLPLAPEAVNAGLLLKLLGMRVLTRGTIAVTSLA
jgi:hypothetical protein